MYVCIFFIFVTYETYYLELVILLLTTLKSRVI